MSPRWCGAIALGVLDPQRALKSVVVHGVFTEPLGDLRIGTGERRHSQEYEESRRQSLRHTASQEW